MTKQTLILLTFIGVGIVFSIITENPFVCLFMGATGKVIAGSYSFTPPTIHGKVIGGCYGTCPSGVSAIQKTMGSSSASGGL